ncbi:CDP-glycerol glycerophosphotransferase family protein [Butyrivibrio sp. YAB3001]|uniref:CDP-glycerol glycerophosphotransferase family protein n=1 Tax=Butyrivibrio sp. YAB3001 TaxID=1520812 RepID=UPI0008F6619E|nr:CDP-glycerol glycerophosphotransferase family protein [Butyrivibrio sp. YAB3001]SFC23280.1 CDP-glycerol glycerophosphotransferase [Butyrivibrio sp. YAB3001]
MKFRNTLINYAEHSKVAETFLYISYLGYACLVSLLFCLYSLFPINKKKIVFCNMKGKRYGDNPYYISESLLEKNKNFDLVWLLKPGVEAELPKGIRRVDYSFISVIKELATAKVWVDSNMKDLGTRKRKEQIFIQTWHGSYGIKKIGLDLGSEQLCIDRKIYPYNAKLADLMVSNSKSETEIFRRAFAYGGKVIEQGSPRNDAFFEVNEELTTKIQNHFDIRGKHIALYAPTWRKGFGIDEFVLNTEDIVNAFQTRFGGEWVILMRLHPHNIEDSDSIKCSDLVRNATQYPNMQELLCVADALITDYSSCMLDFITKPKPCFIYAPDLDDYEKEYGNYYKMKELPFPLALSNAELTDNIIEFDEEKYIENVSELHKRVGLNETGHASDSVVDYIIDFIENGKK